jgi:hypothetical protein
MSDGVDHGKKSWDGANMENNDLQVCLICRGMVEQVLPHFNVAYSNASEPQDVQNG